MNKGRTRKFNGKVEVFLDKASMAPRVGIRWVHTDGVVGVVFPRIGDEKVPELDVGTRTALEWNLMVAKTMCERCFTAILIALLAKNHAAELRALGLRVKDEGWVALESCLPLAVFSALRSKKGSLHALKMLISGRCKADGPVMIRSRPETVLFIDVDAQQITVSPEALETIQRRLTRGNGAAFSGNTPRLSEILRLGDEHLIPLFRGFLVHASNVLFEILRQPRRLDKKVKELLVVVRALGPYLDRVPTYLTFFFPMGHDDVEAALRKVSLAAAPLVAEESPKEDEGPAGHETRKKGPAVRGHVAGKSASHRRLNGATAKARPKAAKRAVNEKTLARREKRVARSPSRRHQPKAPPTASRRVRPLRKRQ